jgi:hypothetical protein
MVPRRAGQAERRVVFPGEHPPSGVDRRPGSEPGNVVGRGGNHRIGIKSAAPLGRHASDGCHMGGLVYAAKLFRRGNVPSGAVAAVRAAGLDQVRTDGHQSGRTLGVLSRVVFQESGVGV